MKPMTFLSRALPGPIVLASTVISQAEVRLVTGGSDNVPHAHNSEVLDISADGDKVLFWTGRPVNGTTPGIPGGGLYIRTLSTDTLEAEADPQTSGAILATMSDDARYLAWSNSPSGQRQQIHWRDRQTDTTVQITLGANQHSYNPVISADGRYVAFISTATNLPVDPSKRPGSGAAVYLYDSEAAPGTGLSIVSLDKDGNSIANGVYSGTREFDFSRDGRHVFFTSNSTDLHADTASLTTTHIYRRTLADGKIEVMSRNPSGQVASGGFLTPRASRDGRRVAFSGGFIYQGTKMLDDVPYRFDFDLYVKDISGPVWRVSTTETGGAGGPPVDGALGTYLSIDGDGDVVAFASTAKNLVVENTEAPEPEDGTYDVFRADLPPGGGACIVSLISKSPSLAGNVDYHSIAPLPGTGAYVAFSTHDVNQMMGVGNANFSNIHGFAVGTLPAVEATDTYSEWAASLPEADRDHGDTPAGDGIKNLMKYVLGMAPLETDVSLMPMKGMRKGTEMGMAGDNGLFLTLDIRVRRDLAPGIRWKVVCADDLASIGTSTVTGVQVGTSTADGDFDVYRFRFPTPVGDNGKGFMRLVVDGDG